MNDDRGAFALDTQWARRSFDRAAASYDAAAIVHADVRQQLLERLKLTAIKPAVIIDAGCGTGHASRALKQSYGDAEVIALDYSSRMLKSAQAQQAWFKRFARVCGDAERLPFKDASVDLIVSNLMIQWCSPDAVFAEFRRVLKPGGLLSFSSFGPDTLHELRSAWGKIDGESHVHPFLDMHDVGDALVRNGFAAPVLDIERITVFYASMRAIFADLKAIGAHNALQSRVRGLTTPRKLAAVTQHYETYRQDGRLPATYEVVFAHAWAPERRPLKDSNTVSLEDVRQQLKSRRPYK
jgi:malonyl-CoA O-methyltransferase